MANKGKIKANKVATPQPQGKKIIELIGVKRQFDDGVVAVDNLNLYFMGSRDMRLISPFAIIF